MAWRESIDCGIQFFCLALSAPLFCSAIQNRSSRQIWQIMDAGEACNSGLEDGCDAKCRMETGWACSPYPVRDAKVNVCNTVLGNGFRVVGHEDCDDGNTNDLDGCSNLMTIENGATCVEDSTGKSAGCCGQLCWDWDADLDMWSNNLQA